MQSGLVKVSDGAYIYYEIEGSGRPVVLVHGWGCSGRFYQKNVEGLRDRYMVVTLDLRGHGKSTKGIDGYRVDRLAQDIHEVVVHLGLKDILLMGWSLGGPTMLSYWKQFGKEEGRLAGLGLIDMTPFPFSSGEWNSHGLRNYNMDGFNAFVAAILKDHHGFVASFIKKMFKDCIVPDGMEWLQKEMTILPPYLGISLYGDYCYSDYTDALSTISVPVLVLSADSGIFPNSIGQGKWIAAQIPQSEFVPFYEGGHMLFWVEAEKFNRAVADFREKIS